MELFSVNHVVTKFYYKDKFDTKSITDEHTGKSLKPLPFYHNHISAKFCLKK